MSDIEQRSFIGEVRAESRESEPIHIIGYGAVFNTKSELMWGFREIIMPGAFDNVLEDDVRALFNHDPNFVLGRSKSGTLSLSIDEQGLKYDITAPDTPTIRDLVIEPLKRGDISQSSFAFQIARNGDDWYENDDGVVIREIHKISRLYDVSPVTYPAYQAASSTTRSFDAWKTARNNGDLTKAVNQRAARERVLQLLRA